MKFLSINEATSPDKDQYCIHGPVSGIDLTYNTSSTGSDGETTEKKWSPNDNE